MPERVPVLPCIAGMQVKDYHIQPPSGALETEDGYSTGGNLDPFHPLADGSLPEAGQEGFGNPHRDPAGVLGVVGPPEVVSVWEEQPGRIGWCAVCFLKGEYVAASQEVVAVCPFSLAAARLGSHKRLCVP